MTKQKKYEISVAMKLRDDAIVEFNNGNNERGIMLVDLARKLENSN